MRPADSATEDHRVAHLLIERTADPLLESLVALVGEVPLPQVVGIVGRVVERRMLEAALERARGNRSRAADLLGLSRQTFHVKVRQHELGTQRER